MYKIYILAVALVWPMAASAQDQWGEPTATKSDSSKIEMIPAIPPPMRMMIHLDPAVSEVCGLVAMSSGVIARGGAEDCLRVMPKDHGRSVVEPVHKHTAACAVPAIKKHVHHHHHHHR